MSETLKKKLEKLNWAEVEADFHARGYALAPGVLGAKACAGLIRDFSKAELYRKAVVMERHKYGRGEYKYFSYPLPEVLQTIRETVYPRLAPIANQWMEWLRLERRFPASFEELRTLCHQNGQTKPTALILQYGATGYNALHQDLYGDIFFPMQLVLFLNEPGQDYTGGEFVMTEQIPRAQSKAIVLSPRRGDMLMFTTNFRPVKSARGYTRAQMRHGVSEVHTGQRHTAGVIFHDANS